MRLIFNIQIFSFSINFCKTTNIFRIFLLIDVLNVKCIFSKQWQRKSIELTRKKGNSNNKEISQRVSFPVEHIPIYILNYTGTKVFERCHFMRMAIYETLH